ncbi:MAG: MSMEG_0567/sll0787 family protein [Frankia sp.]
MTDYRSTMAGLGRPLPDEPVDVAVLLAGLPRPEFSVFVADAADRAAYRQLRREVFVNEQAMFGRHDESDDVDDDPRAVVLVARARGVSGRDGVLGGVRLAPATSPDLGWWRGSRLVVRSTSRSAAQSASPSLSHSGSRSMSRSGGRSGRAEIRGVGAALVRAACAHAEAAGVLRFEAAVQVGNESFFTRLGWNQVGWTVVAGRPHLLMRWPVDRVARLVDGTKTPLGALLAGFGGAGFAGTGLGGAAFGGSGLGGSALGGAGFIGDDAAPVPGSDLVAACDAIVPAMVERDPEWAGWCGVLVNLNDLAAMGATPVGLLDAVGARDAVSAARILRGVRAASEAYGIPVLGGHTQLGVTGALAVTALGRTTAPIPGGGGRPGDDVRLLVDTAGGWRPGYGGRQWDSTSFRRGADLRTMVNALSRAERPPAAAKDVSMAGIIGTLGMMAEASGCAAELTVADIPRPGAARSAARGGPVPMGDWLTCFPGFALLTADRPGGVPPAARPAVSARCGRLLAGDGVRLRWPDGETTVALAGPVTGLGPA